MTARASVIIPAHDESRVLRANLLHLTRDVPDGALEVVVVCNGCTDDTATVARSVPGVRVLEIPEPSKAQAVAVGNRAARTLPRVHLDADVRISGVDVLRLVEAVAEDGILAAAPARRIRTDAAGWPVRAFYRVWEQLPQVGEGLFGRGVFVLSAAGQTRVAQLPRLMSDDLAVSAAFAAHERRIVPDATVEVVAPRTTRDLVRRRIRVATGTSQADAAGVRRSATTLTGLARLGARHPRLVLDLPVFLGVGLIARRRARLAVRAGDYTTWLRDDSSRT